MLYLLTAVFLPLEYRAPTFVAAPSPAGARTVAEALALADGVAHPALDGWRAALADDGAVLAERRDAHLAQRAHSAPDGALTAWYLFDEAYARAHPAWLDAGHRALWHGTVLAKLYDDEARLHTDAQLVDVVRWRGVEAKGVRLGRRGAT